MDNTEHIVKSSINYKTGCFIVMSLVMMNIYDLNTDAFSCTVPLSVMKGVYFHHYDNDSKYSYW